MEEIISQIEVLLQRLKSYASNEEKTKNIRKVSDLFLDKFTYEINIDGKTRVLTRSQYSLIKELLDAENMYCSYERLCTALYGFQSDELAIKSLAVMVTRTRRVVDGLIKIKTVRNKGYIITEVKGYDKDRLL